MTEIHFFVCRHGYGHLKRVLNVVKQLSDIRGYEVIHIHCDMEALAKLTEQSELDFKKDGVDVFIDISIMSESPLYDKHTNLESVDRWLESKAEEFKEIQGMVVIDNDASLLRIFPNACMMGSFLWPVVNEHSELPGLKALAEAELKLLKEIKPHLLCVEGMSMPQLDAYVRKVNQPWFCERNSNTESESEGNAVLVTGGGTSRMTDTFSAIAYEFLNKGIQVFTDRKISEGSGGKLTLFGFTEEDFANLKYIVCRPGMGILTDAVRYGIPVIGIDDGTNAEMSFNIQSMENAGMGKRYTLPTNVDRIINDLDDQKLSDMRKKLMAQRTGGAHEAALWLKDNFKNNTND